jgi:hypothetical protein
VIGVPTVTNDIALNAVLAHFKNLSFEFIQESCDLNRRRELLDGYFSVSPEVMTVTLQPE